MGFALKETAFKLLVSCHVTKVARNQFLESKPSVCAPPWWRKSQITRWLRIRYRKLVSTSFVLKFYLANSH